jgi:cytochrome b subunit of formate dehydrogenase
MILVSFKKCAFWFAMVGLQAALLSGIVLKIRIPYGIEKNNAMPENI